ncbi:MAG TPA: glycogen/starch/alpha-glucan phosphorylase [Thermoanaerobaculia bacterium]|nr:glycogen/starch/alpha-glucan phosphorylase [Thermoanaerobaculia bacterium]
MDAPPPSDEEREPLGLDEGALERDFDRYLTYTLGRDRFSRNAFYDHGALVLAIRDRLMERWSAGKRERAERDCRRVYYLSMEYLLGRALGNALLNLDIEEPVRAVLARAGDRLETLAEQEHDPALGNGGLGRLAACFLDSCATLALPVMGYGIRYEYGVFRQRIADGWQVEEPEHWLLHGYPWEVERPEHSQKVRFGGRTEKEVDGEGELRVRWVGSEDVWAVPYDVPIPGYRNDAVATLRLWKATGTDKFSLSEFNAGDYPAALTAKNRAEHLSMVLYPNDETEAGKRLRLRQQYFLTSASLQDVLRRWTGTRGRGSDFSDFAAKNCFQLNDTHPTVAVAELMRLLMDEHRLEWDEAWEIVRSTMAYTNHTLMPEALERWPVRMFREILPRPFEIIEEIDRRFRSVVAERWPGDEARLRRMAILEDGGEPQVRMAHLGVVGSFSVNGVARLHTELLTRDLFRDFHELWPERFNSKTNGVTPRRWVAGCNPGLAGLLDEALGPGWVTDLERLEGLRPYAEDPGFRERWRAVKRGNKERLTRRVAELTTVVFPPEAMFDVQVKRIHEYKRQLLVALHVIHLYDRLRRGETGGDWTPRAVLVGGKAAPGYRMAKLIVKLVGNLARVVNADPEVGDRLKVVFFPDYRVSAMELICPATDLSEQVSLAGKEASGTGNMKLMMNGALTIGTMDGANIEIREAVGEEHFFRFGLTAEEVAERRPEHDPRAAIEADPDLARAMELLAGGAFNPKEPGIFEPILRQLTSEGDPWLVTADFRSYVEAQERAAACFRDPEAWSRSSVLNAAASGRFSSDRTVAEYNRDIWRLEPVPVKLGG